MKAIQTFSEEYLKSCKAMTPKQIISFIEDFKNLHLRKDKQKSKLISIKIPETMLKLFKVKAKVSGLRYQTQIKVLMEEWLKK
ncbi:MAG: CopG family antitoxin [Elusimicrobiota bacterium]|nr:CopG family antitoxin [Elusimicrobiota bacterium]